ncbi:hypothetical protein B0T19DRAFT_243134 [Cercophora scortea]|uniref:Uncharacterized protein n=1 Tax=Cercophora scortea TaxID=314031 RepID=A0AAE0I9I2_9PEZI|nr:hypothetical protein B0T19DRAFT_243134 [Cercophora scortea]
MVGWIGPCFWCFMFVSFCLGFLLFFLLFFLCRTFNGFFFAYHTSPHNAVLPHVTFPFCQVTTLLMIFSSLFSVLPGGVCITMARLHCIASGNECLVYALIELD